MTRAERAKALFSEGYNCAHVIVLTFAADAGLDEETALAAITSTAAELGGVSHRVGSLTPGKDGDVVVTSGHPLDWQSRVTAVFINGNQVV